MATIEIEINDVKIQELLRGDRGMAVLLEPILNQILQAEMREVRHTGHSDLKDRTWLLSTETCLVCGEVAAYPWTQHGGSPSAHRPMRAPFSSAL